MQLKQLYVNEGYIYFINLYRNTPNPDETGMFSKNQMSTAQ